MKQELQLPAKGHIDPVTEDEVTRASVIKDRQLRAEKPLGCSKAGHGAASKQLAFYFRNNQWFYLKFWISQCLTHNHSQPGLGKSSLTCCSKPPTPDSIFELCERNGQHRKTFLNIRNFFQHYKSDVLPFPALVLPRIIGWGLEILTSDFAAISMVQTFFSFLVFPCASSWRLVYFSSMSKRSCCGQHLSTDTHTLTITETLCNSMNKRKNYLNKQSICQEQRALAELGWLRPAGVAQPMSDLWSGGSCSASRAEPHVGNTSWRVLPLLFAHSHSR